MTERTYTADEVDAMIARAVAAARPPNTLHFAQWTNEEKDLSNYILVGSLTLAGIEDNEYGQSEIDSLENTIEALQERLVTGSEHKKVPLLAYIGGLNTTPLTAQPAPVQDIEHCIWARNGNTPCPHTTPPAAQPAPEQYSVLEQALTRLQKRYGELEAKVAAQPAVPDAFGTREGEHPQYIQGWNDCRQAMMEMMK